MGDSENLDPSKENPNAYRNVIMLKYFMYPIGAWPGEVFGEKVPLIVRYHRIHAPLQSVIIFIGQTNYLILYSNDISFFLKGTCYITTFLCLQTFIRCLMPYFKKYGEIIHFFLRKFHLGFFKFKGGYYKEMYDFIDKVTYYYSIYLITMTFVAMILFNISPFYQNYVNGAYTAKGFENVSLEFAVYYTFPGFDQMNHFRFITGYNMYLSFNCGIAVCSIDLLLSVMVFQIIGHIQILRNSLTTMPAPSQQQTFKGYKNGVHVTTKVAMFNEDENEMIHLKLVECVRHHKMIVQFTDELSSVFGPVLGINYGFHLVSCCLLLLECSMGGLDAVIRFGPLTVVIFGQLIQLSVTFEIVGTVSEKLKEAAYETPWEHMNTRNRRTVCILLNRVQTPINVTAMKMTTVGVTTMASILKTTFSYFAFLRSLQ